MQIRTTNPAGTLVLANQPTKVLAAIAGGMSLPRAIATAGTERFDPEDKARGIDTVPVRVKVLENPEVLAQACQHFGLGHSTAEPSPKPAPTPAPAPPPPTPPAATTPPPRAPERT